VPRIGVLGSYGGLNVGDEAILTSMLAGFRDQCPSYELAVFTRNAEHTPRHHKVDRVVAVRETSRSEVLAEIDELDLLVLGGGGLLYDTEARIYLRDVRAAQEREIPTCGYALGAGPLTDAEDRGAVREVVPGMSRVTVRDQGAKLALEEVGVATSIDVTADPALLLRPEPFTTDMLIREGVPPGCRLIGMSVREPGRAATDLDAEAYHGLLAGAADFMVHRYDANVVFIPMERGDVQQSHSVLGHMVAADRARVLNGCYSPGQLLGLMEYLELVVGMRLHTLIFAAVAGVPFLPLPYAGKVSDFARAIGVPALQAVSRDSVGPLLAAIDHLWDTRRQERERLREVVPALQQRAASTLDLAVQLLHAGR
jgi:polysaccharide pyruvyl transferase CsaB